MKKKSSSKSSKKQAEETPTNEAVVGTTEESTPEPTVMDAVVHSGNVATTEFVVFDPSHPPSEQDDCFGKYFRNSDKVCCGDDTSSNPLEKNPCVMQAECQVRTEARLSLIKKSLDKGRDPNAASKKKQFTMSALTSHLNSLELPKGITFALNPEDKTGYVFYRNKGKEPVLYIHLWTRKGTRQCVLYVSCLNDYSGGVKTPEGWYDNGEWTEDNSKLPEVEAGLVQFADAFSTLAT